jgi:hypothetical protein
MHDDSDFHVSALIGARGASNGLKRSDAGHGQTILLATALDNVGRFVGGPESSIKHAIARRRDTLHGKAPGE